jgi:hypothetical protein
MPSTRRRSLSRKRSTRRYRGGANASFTSSGYQAKENLKGMQERQNKIRTVLNARRKKEINAELAALKNRHYVSESESNNND